MEWHSIFGMSVPWRLRIHTVVGCPPGPAVVQILWSRAPVACWCPANQVGQKNFSSAERVVWRIFTTPPTIQPRVWAVSGALPLFVGLALTRATGSTPSDDSEGLGEDSLAAYRHRPADETKRGALLC